MKSRKLRYAFSLALIVGGVALIPVSILLGYVLMIGGAAARRALARSARIKRQNSGTTWLQYVLAGYLILCCCAALYLAFSGYWQENGVPSGIQLILLGSPLLLMAIAEEGRFYKALLANGDTLP